MAKERQTGQSALISRSNFILGEKQPRPSAPRHLSARAPQLRASTDAIVALVDVGQRGGPNVPPALLTCNRRRVASCPAPSEVGTLAALPGRQHPDAAGARRTPFDKEGAPGSSALAAARTSPRPAFTSPGRASIPGVRQAGARSDGSAGCGLLVVRRPDRRLGGCFRPRLAHTHAGQQFGQHGRLALEVSRCSGRRAQSALISRSDFNRAKAASTFRTEASVRSICWRVCMPSSKPCLAITIGRCGSRCFHDGIQRELTFGQGLRARASASRSPGPVKIEFHAFLQPDRRIVAVVPLGVGDRAARVRVIVFSIPNSSGPNAFVVR